MAPADRCRMNWRVWWVLRDYAGRTVGLWLLALFAQLIQSMTFFAAGIPRIPLLAAVIASMAYTALAGRPNSVLRTLPLTDADGAMIRWWGAFGLPVIAVVGGIALATALSAHKGWIFPSALWLGTCSAGSVAAVACLSAIGRALSHWGTRSASGYVAVVWVALTIVAIIGLPMTVLSAPILCLIFVGSLCLSAAARLPHSRSVCISKSSEPRDRFLAPSWLRSRFSLRATGCPASRRWRFSGFPPLLSGWTVMVFEVARTTAIICVAAFITAAIIHRGIAPWARAGLNGLVIWLVVSAIAVATGLSMRRWVEAVYSLRILPITGRQLIFVLYLAMILPGVLACVALSTAHHFSPDWGLGIPPYMLVVFLPAPLTLFRWERPTGSRPHYLPLLGGSSIQQAVWPAWAGVFCSMLGLPFIPTWFFVYLAALAALFSIAAYRALRAGIHSPTTLESHDGATLKSV
jgi:hypothetical protein